MLYKRVAGDHKLEDWEMSVSYTMASTKPFIIVILLSVYIQNIQCKDLGDETKPANDLLNKPYPVAITDRDLRGVVEQINNAADKIKNRAIASWKYLKRVAEGTRLDIQKWVNNARQYTIDLEKSLQDELQSWQERLGGIVTQVLAKLEELQLCLVDESNTIQTTMTDIQYDVGRCMIREASKLEPIMGKQEVTALNDTLFLADLDRKLDACKADKANYKECLNTVGDLIDEDIKEKHNEILNTGVEVKSLTDNVRAFSFICLGREIAEAVIFLVHEVREIARCPFRRGINISNLE